MAVRQREGGEGREREAGGGPGAGGAAGESTYAKLERALREAYEAARSGRVLGGPASIGLGGLFAEVYTKQYGTGEHAAIFKVFKRDYLNLLCSVELKFKDEKPYEFTVDCLRLSVLASECARGEGCGLSWEEMEDALGLTVWAASRLAELAGIPAKVEGAGLVEAYNMWNGKPSVLPCLQVSVKGKSYSVCQGLRLSHNPDRGWRVKGDYRLAPIGETHAKMVEALAELGEMVWEYVENRKREGAERIDASKYRGKLLELEEVVLRLPDGAEEVLLKPWLPKLEYLGEDFAVVACLTSCPEGSDSELADAVKKDLEEALGKVVQAVRRYMETGDPRLITFAYIAAEAVRRAGLAPA